MTELVAAHGVVKRFEQRLDLVGRMAKMLGADVRDVAVQAVDNVDLAVSEGEVVGLVGESGCGKSTLGRVIAGINPPTAGEIRYRGVNRDTLFADEARAARLAVQMVFQDPMSSLNPRKRVGDIVMEAPLRHGLVARKDRDAALGDILGKVGLDMSYRHRYPHQFSGGQRARIGIARALAVRPRMLVCDESVAALDVSIQAQVLNLFMDIRDEFGLAYLFISHDLGVVRHLADRVVIMYLGRVVETAPAAELFRRPNHPYTTALLAEAPRVAVGRRTFHTIKGEIPSPLAPPPGCHFHQRCIHAGPRCRVEVPALAAIAPGHLSRCHLNDGGTGG